MPIYEYYCDKCEREVVITLPERLHVSDIEDILIPSR
jgi:hypothetical protein